LLVGALFIALYGWGIFRGVIRLEVEQIVAQFVFFVIVFTLILNVRFTLEYAHAFFTDGPKDIINSIVNVVDPEHRDAGAINSAMDRYLDKGMRIGTVLMEDGGWARLYALLVWIVTIVSLAIPAGMAAVADIGIAVMLALTPLFLVFLLFKNTRGFFEAWFRNLMTFVFMIILVYAVMVLSIALLNFSILDLETGARKANIDIADFVPFLLGSGVTWLFYKKLGSIAGSLGLAFAMEGMRFAEMVRNTKSISLGARNFYRSVSRG
jgi:type IV secretion system protein VirB6